MVSVSLTVVAVRYIFSGTAGVYSNRLWLRVSKNCSESDWARLKYHYLWVRLLYQFSTERLLTDLLWCYLREPVSIGAWMNQRLRYHYRLHPSAWPSNPQLLNQGAIINQSVTQRMPRSRPVITDSYSQQSSSHYPSCTVLVTQLPEPAWFSLAGKKDTEFRKNADAIGSHRNVVRSRCHFDCIRWGCQYQYPMEVFERGKKMINYWPLFLTPIYGQSILTWFWYWTQV